MSRIALASAVMVLTAVPLAMGHAEGPAPVRYTPPPGAAPPWADSTTTAAETPMAPAALPTPTSASAPVAAVAPSPAAVPAATAPIPVAVTPEQGTTTPRQAVSLRAGPNTSFPVIGTLHPGDQLEILAIANHGWTEVQSPAGTGWAYGSYLASGTEAAAPPPQDDVVSR